MASRMKAIYLIGSLRNPEIPKIGQDLRQIGFDVFDDWFAGGKIADDSWRDYEMARGRTYQEALSGYAARHVFGFDLSHIRRCDIGVLILPAGKSAHIEFGWISKDQSTYVLMDKPDRWDVMYQFATGVAFSMNELTEMLKKERELT